MPALLVRHAAAGKRKAWVGDDRLRPLDKQGTRQAEGLVSALAPYGVKRLYSSPYVRCRQTVEPLSAELGLPIEERDELSEGAGRTAALGLLTEAGETTAVFCTHGDIVQDVLGEESAKGSAWVLDISGPELVRLEYVSPSV
jgi:8-oxo-(d)GTP phosphatase